MKKFLAILLTFVMLTGIIFALPVTAFAEDICEETPRKRRSGTRRC